MILILLKMRRMQMRTLDKKTTTMEMRTLDKKTTTMKMKKSTMKIQ